jgi:hypothetical protein
MEDGMDKEFLGERRRALEEKYFAKLNYALLKRLRAAEAANSEAGDAHERKEVENDVVRMGPIIATRSAS